MTEPKQRPIQVLPIGEPRYWYSAVSSAISALAQADTYEAHHDRRLLINALIAAQNAPYIVQRTGEDNAQFDPEP